MRIYVEGIGLIAPGLPDWQAAAPVLAGTAPYVPADVAVPASSLLPAAERRRAGVPVKLALAAGQEAFANAGRDPVATATVFTSSSGDGENLHRICEALAGAEREISPTRFHNSVHNAASGYWGIATGSMQPSTSLSAFDATFAAGLLEATTQANSSSQSCLLLAYDTIYPEPLHSLRSIPAAMGVALVLNPCQTSAALAQFKISFSDAPATHLPQDDLEHLRQSIPVARSLPVLALLAQGRHGSVVVDYLDTLRLGIEVCDIA